MPSYTSPNFSSHLSRIFVFILSLRNPLLYPLVSAAMCNVGCDDIWRVTRAVHSFLLKYYAPSGYNWATERQREMNYEMFPRALQEPRNIHYICIYSPGEHDVYTSTCTLYLQCTLASFSFRGKAQRFDWSGDRSQFVKK